MKDYLYLKNIEIGEFGEGINVSDEMKNELKKNGLVKLNTKMKTDM